MKVLVFRLSSLGDLILSTAFLDAIKDKKKEVQINWVTHEQYSYLLESHPAIDQLICFDKKTGLMGWIRLCFHLSRQNYDVIFDLHRSIRTRIAKAFILIFSAFLSGRFPKWFTVKKEKWKQYGYFIFKSKWPKKFRPQKKTKLFLEPLGSFLKKEVQGVPNLSYLTKKNGVKLDQPFYCVMPSSIWSAKQWGVDSYEDYINQESDLIAVVLGTQNDRASLELVSNLEKKKIPHINGIGLWDISQTASVLSQAKYYLGGDTGLAHLAESVGTPAAVLFGPTASDQGFGPWKKESIAIESSLWCRPCGKDGRYCFRINHRFLCQKKIEVKQVRKKIHDSVSFHS